MGFIIGRGRYARAAYPTPPLPASGGGPPTGPAGGDLDGTYPNPGVAKLQNNALDLGTPGSGQDGFVITWVNADGNFQMLAPTGGPPSGAAGGDLSGTYPDPTIASLQTNTLTLPTLGAGQDGFVLTWSNSDGAIVALAPVAQPPSGVAGGDLDGTYPDPGVGSLEGNALGLGTLGAGQDGFVLTWVNADGELEMRAVPSQPPSGTAGGDLDGTYPNPGVAAVNGSPFNISSPTTGDVLLFDGTNWVNSTTLTDLIATVAALQEQVTNLSNGMGFTLSNGGAVPPNVLYEGSQLFSVTT